MNTTPRVSVRLVALAGCTLVVLGCSLGGVAVPPTSTPILVIPTSTTGPTQSSQITSQGNSQHIQFQPGATSATVTGQLAAGATDQWIVSAQSGQVFTAQLSVSNGQAALAISDSHGKTILDGSSHATTYSS